MSAGERPDDRMIRVLLLARYASLGASSRVRSGQFVERLRRDGIDVSISPLFDDRYLETLYARGRRPAWRVAIACLRRIGVLLRSRRFDVLWIEKELFPYLPATAERLLRRLGVPMLVDYDDAIFHNYDLARAPIRQLLGRKIDVVMRAATLVVAGNDYLAARARDAGAQRIETIPTVVDLTRYPATQRSPSASAFRVGWIGSPSTQRYLAPLREVWAELPQRYGNPLQAIGASPAFAAPLGIQAQPWTEPDEVPLLDALDAGIMPLPDDPWERGKCGYKLIQYMACWKPVIASPVGVNAQIVEHGVNGFLASTPAQWRQAIATLAADPELRLRMGRAGRRKVEAQYSLDAVAPRLATCLRETATATAAVNGNVDRANAARPVILFANTDWYLYNFRRSLALALREAGHEVLLISPPGDYGPKLQALGLRWQPVPMRRRSLNPLRELALIAFLARLFRRVRPALVHGFTIKCALYGSLAARLAGVPARIGAVAGMGYVFASDDLKARLLRPAVRTLMRPALSGRNSRLILQNRDDVALFERARLIDPGRIRLISGSGVDLSRFATVPRPRAAGEPMTVLLAARLLWHKGVAEYVDAARRLRRGRRRIRFLLAGSPDAGNPAAVPQATIRTWVDEGAIEWLGHVDDMPSLLARVDAMVLPSFYGEGLPKTLIEAAACGLPLIAADVPGCRDVIEHERSGLLVPARDAGALADAVARLHDDPGLARRLGEAARDKARAQYDERIVIERTLAVYREVMTVRAGLERGGDAMTIHG